MALMYLNNEFYPLKFMIPSETIYQLKNTLFSFKKGKYHEDLVRIFHSGNRLFEEVKRLLGALPIVRVFIGVDKQRQLFVLFTCLIHAAVRVDLKFAIFIINEIIGGFTGFSLQISNFYHNKRHFK